MNAVEQEILKIKQNHQVYRELISFEPDDKFEYELSTIQINLGRQKGHTTAIDRMCKKMDLIIFPSFFVKNFVCRSPLFTINNKDYYCLTLDAFIKERNCPIYEGSSIWIDNYSLLQDNFELESKIMDLWFRNKIEYIYKLG